MEKIEENLTKGEEILIEAKQSNIMLIVGAVITVICFLITPILGVLFVVLIYLQWFVSLKTNSLYITNKRVYGSVGFIKKEELDMPLKSINAISISKGLFGSIFGYAKVSITTNGEGWTFKFVSNAKELKKVFYEAQG